MIKYAVILVILMVTLILRSMPAYAADKAAPGAQANIVQQQMILLGLYMYGIDQERSKGFPSLTQLRFFGDSICEISKRLQATKIGVVHHQNLQELLKNAQSLKTAKTMSDAKFEAGKLMDNCASCHGFGKNS